MIIDLFLLIIGFLGISIASISDIKTQEVPDFVTYSMIFSGLSLRALHAFTYNELSYFTFALINLIIFFIIANILYYTKQWGGGDAKLLMGISVVFATYPNFLLQYFTPKINISFPLVIFINILLIGLIYNLIWAIVLAIKNKQKFIKEFKNINKKFRITKKLIFLIIILLIFSSIMLKNLLILTFIILLIFTFYLTIFIKAIENACMLKTISVKQLREGDWVHQNIYYKNKLIYKKSFTGVTKKQIQLIKKTNLKKILIKQGIPFTSVFFIALIVSIIFGNLILYFIQ